MVKKAQKRKQKRQQQYFNRKNMSKQDVNIFFLS